MFRKNKNARSVKAERASCGFLVLDPLSFLEFKNQFITHLNKTKIRLCL